MIRLEPIFKKNKESIRFIAVCFFLLGGYVFFFSSAFWMDPSVDASYLTQIGSPTKWENREVIINRWDYQEEASLMEVEVSIENRTYDGKNKYTFSAVDLRGNEIKVKPIIEEDNWIILQLEDIPDRWSDISLRMEVKNSDEDRLKLYTNVNDVNRVNEIIVYDRTGYLIKKIDTEIKNDQKLIDNKKKEIDTKNSEIEEINKEITRLTNDKIYQTDAEKIDTDNLIGEANSNISTKQNEIIKLNSEIEELEAQIQIRLKQKEDLNE